MHKTDLTVCTVRIIGVNSKLWPGAEDKALRGRNLSAVFRTLYRQVGEALVGLPSCAANSWRVENQSAKSTGHITPKACFRRQQTRRKHSTSVIKQTVTTDCPFFPGKYMNGNVPAVVEIEVVLKFHLGGLKS